MLGRKHAESRGGPVEASIWESEQDEMNQYRCSTNIGVQSGLLPPSPFCMHMKGYLPSTTEHSRVCRESVHALSGEIS